MNRIDRKKNQTRKALLQTALKLFHEKGIYWSKVEDITERSDIGKGTFYHYFTSKEELLCVLLEGCLQSLYDFIQTETNDARGESEFLKKAVKAHLKFFISKPDVLFFLHQIRGLLQLKTGSSKDLKKTYDRFFDKFGKGFKTKLTSAYGKERRTRELGMALSFFTTGLLTYTLLFESNNGKWGHHSKALEPKLLEGIRAFWRS